MVSLRYALRPRTRRDASCALREEHRTRIADALGRAAGNGHRILRHLYEYPIVSATQVQTLLGTTDAAANQIVGRLVEAGILRKMAGHARHRRFRYDAYVRLFDDETVG